MLFQELIQKSRGIDIELSPEIQDHDMANALTLFVALSKLGKRVRFQSKNNIPLAFGWIDAPSLSAQTAVLAIKEIAPFLSKVSYEKSDRDIKFQLSLREDALRVENIAVENPLETDLTIIVGENRPQDNFEITTNPHLKIKNQKKMLEASLALLSAFEIPETQLFLKTLLNMQYLPEKKLCVAVLEKKDFEEAGAHTKDLGPLLAELHAIGTPQTSHLVLFGVQGLLFSKTKEFKEKISKFFKTTERGDWTLFALGGQEIQKTKEKILFLL